MADQPEAIEQRFGDDIDSPEIPKYENPEDSEAPTRVKGGARGLGAGHALLFAAFANAPN